MSFHQQNIQLLLGLLAHPEAQEPLEQIPHGKLQLSLEMGHKELAQLHPEEPGGPPILVNGFFLGQLAAVAEQDSLPMVAMEDLRWVEWVELAGYSVIPPGTLEHLVVEEVVVTKPPVVARIQVEMVLMGL